MRPGPAVDARYADSIGRLVSVADASVADSGQADLDEKARLTELAERERALRDLLTQLST